MGRDDPPDDPPEFCEVCGEHPDACECPECKKCGQTGVLACFVAHGLLLKDGTSPPVMWHGNPGIEGHDCWVCRYTREVRLDPDLYEDFELTSQEKAGMVMCRGCCEWCFTVYCNKCAADGKANCVHGKAPSDCDTCDHLADLAFDAAREDR